VKKEQKYLKTEFLKSNFKNGSNLLIKFLVPELDLDWDGVYFILKDTKDHIKWKIKKK
jgi:hypothetical protein